MLDVEVMTALKDYSQGHLVGVFRPYVQQLSSFLLSSHCSHCFSKNEALRKCTGCSRVAYCSALCQKGSWKWHKWVCSLMRHATLRNPTRPTIPSDSALFLFKLYCHSRSSRGSELRGEIEGISRSFEQLMSHMDEIRVDSKRLESFEKALVQLRVFVAPSQESLDLQALLQTFGKMLINSFSVLDDDLNNAGTALYLGPSFLDHSCQGNCVCIFKGTSLKLRCATTIKGGQKMTISYIDVMKSTADRVAELQESYYFQCRCPSCLSSGAGESAKKVERGEEEESLGEGVDEKKDGVILQKLESSFNDFSSKEQETENGAGEWALADISHFPPLHQRFESCVSLQKWEESLAPGRLICRFYQRHLEHPTPNYIFHLVKLAKIHLLLHQNVHALHFLQQAQPLVRLFYDPHDFLSQQHLQLMQQCRQELR